jgi:hypothetical protein
MASGTTIDPSDKRILEFYRGAEPLTDPRPHAALLDALPRDFGALCAAIQGLVLHLHWSPAYGVTLSEEHKRDAQARSLAGILAGIRAHDDRPLDLPRPPAARFVGTCRDFTVLLCAALRHQGVPARARCGFGAYFRAGTFEDHWVCEHWSAEERRWIRTDAQLDALQCEALKLRFDPQDVPEDEFLVAGRAWQACRSGSLDAAHFGIFDMRGLWFIRGNVLRDLAALNRMELLPWDCWGLMLEHDESDSSDAGAQALVDRAAALTLGGDEAFDEMRVFYQGEAALRVEGAVMNVQTGVKEAIEPS